MQHVLNAFRSVSICSLANAGEIKPHIPLRGDSGCRGASQTGYRWKIVMVKGRTFDAWPNNYKGTVFEVLGGCVEPEIICTCSISLETAFSLAIKEAILSSNARD